MPSKKTLVLGASDNPSRYSYLAIHRLLAAGHPVEAIGRKEMLVGGIKVRTGQPVLEGIDTVTLYINPQHQQAYHNYILSLNPRRILFNPGTENDDLITLASARGIECTEACTLVLLSTNQY